MKKIRILLLVLMAAALLLTLTSTGCKKKGVDDITGTWFFTITIDDFVLDETYEFVGTDASGEVYWEGQALGTYSAFGDHISFTLEYIDPDDEYTVEVYNGTIFSEDTMSGSVTITYEISGSISGVWFSPSFQLITHALVLCRLPALAALRVRPALASLPHSLR